MIALLSAAIPATLHAQDDAETSTDTASEIGEPTEDGSSVAEDEESVAPPVGQLSMGEEVDENAPGRTFIAAEFGDWQQRCIRTEDGSDPCQLYQLLRDGDGNAVAEMSVFGLPDGQQAAAGATVITPLETLLTRQLTLTVDSGQAKRYPFDFCSAAGCFARIGLTDAEIASFKRGSEARLMIVPAAAPDQEIMLTVSLSGFTAGYDAVEEANADTGTAPQ